jgi:peptide/nickel transport system substrate-binding protein
MPAAAASLALLLSAPLTVTSCTQLDKQDKEPSPSPAAAKAAAQVAAPAADTAHPRMGGHIRLASNEPRYLNPILETRLERASTLIFEGLVGLDARLEPVPRLATRWEQSPDGKVITFHLRQGVTWHDGHPFTARDVVFTFQAIQEIQAPSLWKAYMSAVDTLEAPDDHTVVVKYRYAYAPALTSWTIGILPMHVYGGEDILSVSGKREPVGTGPYKLARWEPGKRLLLQANPRWWDGRPNVDTIELLLDLPEDRAVEALARGDIDFARIDDIEKWLDEAQLPEFREKFEVSDVIESRIRLIAWNLHKEPLRDARVRRALTHALDRGRVIEATLFGQARPLSAPFFPNMFGADPSIAPWPFDLNLAGKLLDEAGHGRKGESPRMSLELIALESQRGPEANDALGTFREDLSAIGVELEIRFVPVKEFFQRLEKRDFDAAYFTWLPDIPDPDPYGLLHSSMIGLGANFAGYANPDVDRLLDEARATADREARKAQYHKLHRILHEELPYTPLYAPYGHYAWSRRLRGVSPHDVSSQPRFPGMARWWTADPQDEAPKLR